MTLRRQLTQAMLAHLGSAGLEPLLQGWVGGCIDDIATKGSPIRNFLEEVDHEYGPGCEMLAAALRDRFLDWASRQGIRSPITCWTAENVDDAFSYAERRFASGSRLEPKNAIGMEFLGRGRWYQGIRPKSLAPQHPIQVLTTDSWEEDF